MMSEGDELIEAADLPEFFTPGLRLKLVDYEASPMEECIEPNNSKTGVF